jgi:8-oxo-dGTP pyrophosphatase MutT (NUDIX family)
VAWTGRIFNVNRLRVKLPDGRTAVRDVVRHPGAVAVVALTDEGRICLVRQFRTALDRVTVEIPAGKLDPGEDPLDAPTASLPRRPACRPRRWLISPPLLRPTASATSSSTSTWRRT